MNIQYTMTSIELLDFLEFFGLSNSAFADLIQVTKPAVDHWVSGRRAVPPTTVKLCNYFRKYPQRIDDFMGC